MFLYVNGRFRRCRNYEPSIDDYTHVCYKMKINLYQNTRLIPFTVLAIFRTAPTRVLKSDPPFLKMAAA